MKIILTVINGFGIGELNDSAIYGDEGANSYKNAKDAELPVLRLLGLDNIFNVGYREVKTPQGAYGRMRSLSVGKNPYIQYRELLGIINYDKNAADYPNAHPECDDLISRLASNGIKTRIYGSASIYTGGDRAASKADVFMSVDDESVCESAVKDLLTDMDDALYIVSFDGAAKAGLKRDKSGYVKALEKIDSHIGHIIDGMFDDDIIIICGDNGCDCLFTNHNEFTREYVPILFSGRMINKNCDVKTVHGYDTIAHTVLDFFNILTTHKSIKQSIIAKDNQPQLLTRIKKLIKVSRNNPTEK